MRRFQFQVSGERRVFKRFREPVKVETFIPFYRMMERGTFKRKKNPIRYEW